MLLGGNDGIFKILFHYGETFFLTNFNHPPPTPLPSSLSQLNLHLPPLSAPDSSTQYHQQRDHESKYSTQGGSNYLCAIRAAEAAKEKEEKEKSNAVDDSKRKQDDEAPPETKRESSYVSVEQYQETYLSQQQLQQPQGK